MPGNSGISKNKDTSLYNFAPNSGLLTVDHYTVYHSDRQGLSYTLQQDSVARTH